MSATCAMIDGFRGFATYQPASPACPTPTPQYIRPLTALTCANYYAPIVFICPGRLALDNRQKWISFPRAAVPLPDLNVLTLILSPFYHHSLLYHVLPSLSILTPGPSMHPLPAVSVSTDGLLHSTHTSKLADHLGPVDFYRTKRF